MDAIELLTNQHRRVEELFRQLHEARGRARVGLLGTLAEELTVHALLEEEIFYPTARERTGPAAVDVLDESARDHQEVKNLVAELLDTSQTDPRLQDLLARLEQAVGEHVGDEEKILFPKVAEAVNEGELRRLGERMHQREERLREGDLLEQAETSELPMTPP